MVEEPTTPETGGAEHERRDGDGGEGREPSEAADREVPEPLPLSQLVGRGVLAAVAVLFVVFAVVNRQPVDFDWVFGESVVETRGGEYAGGGIPLIVLLLGSFVLGALVGAGLLWRRRRHRRRRREHEEDR